MRPSSRRSARERQNQEANKTDEADFHSNVSLRSLGMPGSWWTLHALLQPRGWASERNACCGCCLFRRESVRRDLRVDLPIREIQLVAEPRGIVSEHSAEH